MAFRDILEGVRNFFGPNNTFFNGTRESDTPTGETDLYPPQNAQPAPQQPPYQQQAPYQQQGSYQQAYQGAAYAQPNAYQQPGNPYQQPVQQQAPYQQQAYAQPQQQTYTQPQQQAYQQSPMQQGYQMQQQTVNQPYVQPRNRRAAHHTQEAENVVPFPGTQAPQGAAAAPSTPQPVQPQAETAPATFTTCVVNVSGITDCRESIGLLRTGNCIIAVLDSIADQAEVRRYVDTLNGACFSLGCTMTRISARVGVYLLAPANMQVYTDQRTTQMNSQSRVPQRNPRSAQNPFRPPYAQQGYQTYAQQPVYQQPPVFSAQQPAQGYSPDVEYSDAVM